MDQRAGAGVTDDGRAFGFRRHGGLAVVLQALPDDVARVYLVGKRPGRGPSGWRRWRDGPLPPLWAVAGAGHYLEREEHPVMRFECWLPGGVRRVELHRAATWFGELPAGVDEARRALGRVGELLAGEFGADRARVLSTPGTTGTALFVSSIPHGAAWDVATDEHQELIRHHSGQGRVELLPAPVGNSLPSLPALAELDGRFMYAALCRELGAGPMVRDRCPEFEPYARGRYLVDATVPDGWGHVGLLGVFDGERWSYPRAPGQVFRTWCDGAELRLAHDHGWKFTVVERLRLAHQKADPLGGWARRLVSAWRAAEGDELARAAVRNVLLHGIGRFVAKPRLVTHSTPVERSREVPADAVGPRVDGERILWGEWRPPAQPELAHPEWAAAVWARARTRLLSGPGNTGALHVDFSSVVAMRTDALYLDRDPGWPDDGAPGRLRLKAFRPGPHPWPKTERELMQLREVRAP